MLNLTKKLNQLEPSEGNNREGSKYSETKN